MFNEFSVRENYWWELKDATLSKVICHYESFNNLICPKLF